MKANTISRLLLLLALTAPAIHAQAQARSNVHGTIDTIELGDNYIVIGGERLVLRFDDIVITYKDKMIRPSRLREGFTVMYSTRADGSISKITLIGPPAILDQFDNDH